MKIGTTNITNCKSGNTQIQKVFSGTNLIWSSVDPDAQAFITAASITDPTQQSAVNQLVLDLKAASIWTKGSVINPYIGGTATAHRYNLKTATMDTSWAGGITHDVNGVTYNGTTGYGSIGFQATAGNQYNRSMFQYIRAVTTRETAAWQGAFNGTHVFGMQACRLQGSGDAYTLYQDGLNRLTQTTTLINFGLVGVTVTASNSAKAYNGSTVKININNPNATPNNNLNLYTGALNSSGSPLLYGNHNIAFEFYGDGLTDTDVSNLYTAVQTFQTTLSRNV